MALNPQVIGKEMPHGFAGSYARQPDMIVNTRPAGEEIPFGAALTYDKSKAVVVFGRATDNKFIGVAGTEIKSTVTWPTQNGQYAQGEPVSVFMSGSINVKCQRSTPSLAALCMCAPPLTTPTPAVWWADLRRKPTAARPSCWITASGAGPPTAMESRS